VLEELSSIYPAPPLKLSDKGPEFIAQVLRDMSDASDSISMG
jgi:hypothetical protein